MQFYDDSADVELKFELGDESISPGEVYVDAKENSLVIRVQHSGCTKTLLDTDSLYGMIKPSETIWYLLWITEPQCLQKHSMLNMKISS